METLELESVALEILLADADAEAEAVVYPFIISFLLLYHIKLLICENYSLAYYYVIFV